MNLLDKGTRGCVGRTSLVALVEVQSFVGVMVHRRSTTRTDHRLTDSPSHCKSQHATSTAGKMPTFIGPTAGDSERLKLAANQKYYRSAVLRAKLA
jgi:hypothetical protein